MNERFECSGSIEPQVIDRLVDGELSASEVRTLLDALDARPDGWRRCALAFLEARAWRDDLAAIGCDHGIGFNGKPVGRPLLARSSNGAIAASIAVCATGSSGAALAGSKAVSQRAATANPPRTPWSRVGALAASIALAFFLGIAARGYWSTSGDQLRDQGAAQGGNSGVSPGGIAMHDEPPNTDSATDSRSAEENTITMTLVDSQGNPERRIDVPLVETDRFDPGWLASRPAAMPPAMIEQLRRSGYRVDEQRLYVPVLLDDGRPAIVPFDQAQVTYTGLQF